MEKEIQILHSQGLLNTEIAKIINKSPDTVAYYLKKLNLINNRNKKSIFNKDLIIKLLKEGNTIYFIKNFTQCSTTFIKKLAKENNIDVQSKEEYINSIKNITHNPFENLTNNEVNYWLGFLSADGAIFEDRVTLGLQELDYQHIEKFKNFLNSENLKICKTIKNTKLKKYIGYRVAFRNKEVVSFLNNLGITCKKSLTLNINLKINKDFLRGVIDGDGYIRKKGYEISIASGSKIFAKQLKNSINELFKINAKIYKSIKYSKNPKYTISILGKNNVKTVLTELYTNADIYLERKYLTALLVSNS
jgi:DNA-binding CsgD family transcriptional regulator